MGHIRLFAALAGWSRYGRRAPCVCVPEENCDRVSSTLSGRSRLLGNRLPSKRMRISWCSSLQEAATTILSGAKSTERLGAAKQMPVFGGGQAPQNPHLCAKRFARGPLGKQLGQIGQILREAAGRIT